MPTDVIPSFLAALSSPSANTVLLALVLYGVYRTATSLFSNLNQRLDNIDARMREMIESQNKLNQDLIDALLQYRGEPQNEQPQPKKISLNR